MADQRIQKLENPVRLAELAPKETLLKAGLKNKMTLCDIGAGTGIFTFAAAEITENTVYALDISDSMIALIQDRAKQQGKPNIKPVKVNSADLPINAASIDMAIMVTVLHEIDDKPFMIKEMKRVLKEQGTLLLIDFHKRTTPMGPPDEMRLSAEESIKLCEIAGLKVTKQWDLGENLYAIVFTR